MQALAVDYGRYLHIDDIDQLVNGNVLHRLCHNMFINDGNRPPVLRSAKHKHQEVAKMINRKLGYDRLDKENIRMLFNNNIDSDDSEFEDIYEARLFHCAKVSLVIQ